MLTNDIGILLDVKSIRITACSPVLFALSLETSIQAAASACWWVSGDRRVGDRWVGCRWLLGCGRLWVAAGVLALGIPVIEEDTRETSIAGFAP